MDPLTGLLGQPNSADPNKQRNFGDWLAGFVNYGGYSEAPNNLLFWTGVSTLAGALRRRVWIDQSYFTWVPNFYIVFVAKPGVATKSTTINVGMNLLRRVPNITFGPDVVTWQALVQSMEAAAVMVPYPGDPTKMYPMAPITVASDEFGAFLDPDDRKMIDVMVSLWDGKRGTFTKVTKTSGSDSIENPWINVIGCTTPAWMAQNFPEYMIGGGFTSRCVFLYAKDKRQLVSYPGLVVPSTQDAEATKLVEDLEAISLMFGEYVLSKEAVVWGSQWYDDHWNNRAVTKLKGSEYEGYLARKQTHIHKLAMILAASQSSRMEISKAHLEAAAKALETVENELPEVFRYIGLSAHGKLLMSIREELAKNGGTMPYANLLQNTGLKSELGLFNQALELGEAAGLIERGLVVNPKNPMVRLI